MVDEVSSRVVDQRCRNRVIEAIDLLADGSVGVRLVGGVDYFEIFFDWMDADGRPHANPSMTDEEMDELRHLAGIVNKACVQSNAFKTDESLIASGIPDQIAPAAAHALAIFRERGLYDESAEEAEPSGRWFY